MLNFTFCVGPELNTLHPSVSAKRGCGKKFLYISSSLGRGEGVSLVESAFPLSFSFTASLPQNESEIWVVVNRQWHLCALLKEKGGQNLNIYLMHCETMIPVLLASFCWRAFYSRCLCIFRLRPAKSDITRKEVFAWTIILLGYTRQSVLCSNMFDPKVQFVWLVWVLHTVLKQTEYTLLEEVGFCTVRFLMHEHNNKYAVCSWHIINAIFPSDSC